MSLPSAIGLLAAAIALAVPAACGGGDEDSAAFCAAAEERWEALTALPSPEPGVSMDEVTAALDAVEKAEEAARKAAPGSISDEVEMLLDGDPESIRVSEQEAYEDAQAKVDEFLRSECDLAISF